MKPCCLRHQALDREGQEAEKVQPSISLFYFLEQVFWLCL